MKKIVLLCMVVLMFLFSSCSTKKALNVDEYIKKRFNEDFTNKELLYECDSFGWQGDGWLYAVYKYDIVDENTLLADDFHISEEEIIVQKNTNYVFVDYFQKIVNCLNSESESFRKIDVDYRINFDNIDEYYYKNEVNGAKKLFALYDVADEKLYYLITVGC